MKEIYKYVEMECGNLYVVMTGITQTVLLHVDNMIIIITVLVSIYVYHFIIVFNNSGHAYSQSSFFGGSQDIAPLVWERFNCVDNETSLTECSNYSYGYNSTCTKTAGIYCSGKLINHNYQYFINLYLQM